MEPRISVRVVKRIKKGNGWRVGATYMPFGQICRSRPQLSIQQDYFESTIYPSHSQILDSDLLKIDINKVAPKILSKLLHKIINIGTIEQIKWISKQLRKQTTMRALCCKPFAYYLKRRKKYNPGIAMMLQFMQEAAGVDIIEASFL